MILDQSTNFSDIYRACNGVDDRDLIWLMYHHGRTEISELPSHPRWNLFKNVVLIDQESEITQADMELLDDRVHLWSPTLLSHPRMHTYLFWFDWLRIIDSATQLSQRLLAPDQKQPKFLFDALLGTLRPTKKFVFDSINCSKHTDLFLLGSVQTRNICNDDTDEAIPSLPNDWVPGGDFDNFKVKQEYQPGMLCNSDCMIPYEIYNNSWYTLVGETYYKKSFFTEKTGRPLISRRLFVMFSSQGFLRDLRKLGYQTFGSVIDESYDDEPDDVKRWSMAWQQVEKLMTLDPIWVYQQIKPVLDHNYQIISTTDYEKKIVEEIKILLTTT